MLYFEWDEQKAETNLRRHGISFEAASSALEDAYAQEEDDLSFEGEQRLRTLGMAEGGTVLLVIHTERRAEQEQDRIARIISARKASPGERRDYEQHRAKSGWNPSK